MTDDFRCATCIAVAMDHEGYTAWLVVHPNFGCVQWLEGQPR